MTAFQAMKSMDKRRAMGSHQSARPQTEVWLTPPEILTALGPFDLDPCAACEPRPWPTARNHYTIRDNGLVCRWNGRVWLNPPYSTLAIRKWLARMSEHGTGTALIFARTETEHFAKYVWPACDALLFLHGRLNFHHASGDRAPANAGAPSVLCAYGVDDADALAGCGLDGAFVPLKLRAFIFGLKPGTWMQEIERWMAGNNAPVHLSDLYRAFAGSAKAKRNPNYQAKIRQVLQSGPFERLGDGFWKFGEV